MTDRPSLTRCLATLGSAVAVVVILFAGLVLGTTLFFSTADKTEQAPATGDTPLIIAAIGDAYMSGEGATAFFPGTDRPGRNQCRRTSASYPFLLAANLAPGDGHDGIALVSAACSGARTTHLIPFEGISCQDDWFPDGCPEPQYEFVSDGRSDPAFQVERIPENADIVLVSVGAADAQLNDVIATCGASQTSCRASVMPWIDAFDATLQWRLRSVYAAVRKVAPNAGVVALTYPIPIFREACGSTRLDQDETDLIIDDFIPRLNEQISLAAAAERIRLVDLSEVFAGHRLCQPDRPGGEQPEIAMNAYQVRPVRGLTWKFSTWFHGSFYPSEFGHEIIAERLVRELDRLITAPDQFGPPDPPTAAAIQRPVFLASPPGRRLFETDSACGSRSMESVTIARPIQSFVVLETVDRASTVCVRASGAGWVSSETTSGANVRVSLPAHGMDGFAGWHEILYRTNGTWVRVVVVAPGGTNTAALPLARAWAWPWLVTAASIVAQPVIYVTLVAFLIGGSLMWCMRRPRPNGT